MTGSSAIDTRLSDLIGHLYDAAIDERLWMGIAPRIASAFDSTSAVLKMHGGDDVDLLENTENLVVAPSGQSFAEHWHRTAMWVRSEEHTSEIQSLMSIPYASLCL